MKKLSGYSPFCITMLLLLNYPVSTDKSRYRMSFLLVNLHILQQGTKKSKLAEETTSDQ
jgi:hypothetical protein